jgi:hypothetical protein
VVSTIPKSWVIVAVLAIIADAGQYFSTDSAMARSTFSGATPSPLHHEMHVNAVNTFGSCCARSASSSTVTSSIASRSPELIERQILQPTHPRRPTRLEANRTAHIFPCEDHRRQKPRSNVPQAQCPVGIGYGFQFDLAQGPWMRPGAGCKYILAG